MIDAGAIPVAKPSWQGMKTAASVTGSMDIRTRDRGAPSCRDRQNEP